MRFLINILIGLFFIFTLYSCKDEPQRQVKILQRNLLSQQVLKGLP